MIWKKRELKGRWNSGQITMNTLEFQNHCDVFSTHNKDRQASIKLLKMYMFKNIRKSISKRSVYRQRQKTNFIKNNCLCFYLDYRLQSQPFTNRSFTPHQLFATRLINNDSFKLTAAANFRRSCVTGTSTNLHRHGTAAALRWKTVCRIPVTTLIHFRIWRNLFSYCERELM
jgi:hypothetical protein